MEWPAKEKMKNRYVTYRQGSKQAKKISTQEQDWNIMATIGEKREAEVEGRENNADGR